MRGITALVATLAIAGSAGCAGTDTPPPVNTRQPEPPLSQEAAISAVAGAMCPGFPALFDEGLVATEDGADWRVVREQATFTVNGETGAVFAENAQARLALSLYRDLPRC